MSLPSELRLHIMEYIIVNEGPQKNYYFKHAADLPIRIVKNRPMLRTCTTLSDEFRKILAEETIHFMHHTFPAERQGFEDVKPSDQIFRPIPENMPKRLRLVACLPWMDEFLHHQRLRDALKVINEEFSRFPKSDCSLEIRVAQDNLELFCVGSPVLAVNELTVIAWDDINAKILHSQFLSDGELQEGHKTMIANFPNVTRVQLEWILFAADEWVQSDEEKLLAEALRSSDKKNLEVKTTVRIAIDRNPYQGKHSDGSSHPAS